MSQDHFPFVEWGLARETRKEVPSLIPGTSSRPADNFLPNWCWGRPTTLDVTVISTLQSLTLVGAAATQGHALRVGEERKMATHNEACLSVGVVFTLESYMTCT